MYHQTQGISSRDRSYYPPLVSDLQSTAIRFFSPVAHPWTGHSSVLRTPLPSLPKLTLLVQNAQLTRGSHLIPPIPLPPDEKPWSPACLSALSFSLKIPTPNLSGPINPHFFLSPSLRDPVTRIGNRVLGRH